jgi:hypothetical protein
MKKKTPNLRGPEALLTNNMAIKPMKLDLSTVLKSFI